METASGSRSFPRPSTHDLTIQPTNSPFSSLERVRERIPRATEGVADARHGFVRLVRVVVGRVGVVVLEPLAIFAAARVGAGEDQVVRSARAPALELTGAHRVERVLAERGVDQLEDPIPPVTAALVLRGLPHELLHARRVAVVGATRE